MSDYPPDWIEISLGDSFSVKRGDSSLTKSAYRSTGTLAYSASGPDGFVEECQNDGAGIIISSVGAQCGKIFKASGKWTAINNTIAITEKIGEFSIDYLYCLLERQDTLLPEGGAQPFISQKEVMGATLHFPPLPEQKKIAEILSGIDNAIKAELVTASKVDMQYQGFLRQIFGCDSSTLSIEQYSPLGELDLDISDGNYSSKYPSANEFVERGIPFIRASNMKDGSIDDNDMRFISADKHREITKGHLKAGDILIANRGDIGKSSRVPARHIGSNINAQVVRINGGGKLDQSFLYHYFSSPFCQGLIDELTTGTALKQLPIGNLVKLLIPAPDMTTQTAIGQALDSMQKVIDISRKKAIKNSNLKQAVASDLLSGRKRVSV